MSTRFAVASVGQAVHRGGGGAARGAGRGGARRARGRPAAGRSAALGAGGRRHAGAPAEPPVGPDGLHRRRGRPGLRRRCWVDRSPGAGPGARRPAAAVRGPAAAGRPGRRGPLQRRRVRDPGPGAGGADRALVLRRRRGRGVRAGRHDRDRVPGDGRRGARPRDRLPPSRGRRRAVADEHLRSRPAAASPMAASTPRPRTWSRSSTRSSPGAWWGSAGATRCCGRGRGADEEEEVSYGARVPDGRRGRARAWIGHSGGDPGVAGRRRRGSPRRGSAPR